VYFGSYDVTAVQRSAFSRVRSKVIVRPSAVFELGIHHVSRPLYSLPAAAAARQGSATHSAAAGMPATGAVYLPRVSKMSAI